MDGKGFKVLGIDPCEASIVHNKRHLTYKNTASATLTLSTTILKLQLMLC